MTTRNGSLSRFRLPLALGLAAAIPALGAWAQDPAREKADDQDSPPPATASEKAERKADEIRAKARQAREEELKSVAEKIRQKREAIEAEAARTKAEAEARRANAERERAKIQAEASNRQANLLLLDLRIEATKDALKAVWKRIAEAELQQALKGPSPDATHDAEALAILKKQADNYEQQIRECIARKAQLTREAQDFERGLDRVRSRVNRPAPTPRSVADSVDRLLNHLGEQGALDDRDHRHLNDAVGALEELIDIFRDRAGDHDPDREPTPNQAKPESRK